MQIQQMIMAMSGVDQNVDPNQATGQSERGGSPTKPEGINPGGEKAGVAY
jgi:hypothetical protein